jgi:hypothetical protein
MTRPGVHLQSVGLAELSGFMISHGCVDATATLKIALQSLKASNQEAYGSLVDSVNDFDSLHDEMVSKILTKYGVPEPPVNVIVIMCAHIEISARVGKARVTFPSTSGVKQDKILAPVLFLVAIQAAVESMNEKCRLQTEKNTSTNETSPRKINALSVSKCSSMQTMLRLSLYQERSFSKDRL